jgi:hypothetical protein
MGPFWRILSYRPLNWPVTGEKSVNMIMYTVFRIGIYFHWSQLNKQKHKCDKVLKTSSAHTENTVYAHLSALHQFLCLGGGINPPCPPLLPQHYKCLRLSNPPCPPLSLHRSEWIKVSIIPHAHLSTFTV